MEEQDRYILNAMPKNQNWGRYQSSLKRFSISVPLCWSVKELEDQLEIQDEAGSVSVIVSSFSRRDREPIDVVAQLQRFLDLAKIRGEAKIENIHSNKVSAQYVDTDGAQWYVIVQAGEARFLLVTCNTADAGGKEQFRAAREVVESVKLHGFPVIAGKSR